MKYQNLQMKAEFSGGNLVVLREEDKIRKGDYIEWLYNELTSIDEESPYIGKTINDILQEVGRWTTSGSGASFKRKIVRIQLPQSKINP